jgi:hypothetical protein
MDPVSLAPFAVSMVLPYLQKIAGKLVEKSLEAAPDVVGKAWDLIKEKLESKPETAELPKDVEKNPESKPAQGALEYQLTKLLENDAAFAKQLEKLVKEAKKQAPSNSASLKGSGAIAQGNGAVAVGSRGVHIGGKASGNMIITGDKNSVNTKKTRKKK